MIYHGSKCNAPDSPFWPRATLWPFLTGLVLKTLAAPPLAGPHCTHSCLHPLRRHWTSWANPGYKKAMFEIRPLPYPLHDTVYFRVLALGACDLLHSPTYPRAHCTVACEHPVQECLLGLPLSRLPFALCSVLPCTGSRWPRLELTLCTAWRCLRHCLSPPRPCRCGHCSKWALSDRSASCHTRFAAPTCGVASCSPIGSVISQLGHQICHCPWQLSGSSSQASELSRMTFEPAASIQTKATTVVLTLCHATLPILAVSLPSHHPGCAVAGHACSYVANEQTSPHPRFMAPLTLGGAAALLMEATSHTT